MPIPDSTGRVPVVTSAATATANKGDRQLQDFLSVMIDDLNARNLGPVLSIPATAGPTAALTAPNDSAGTAITVPGATVGDIVVVGSTQTSAGMVPFGFVSAANTVTAYYHCAASGTPSAGNFQGWVIHLPTTAYTIGK